MMESRNRNLTLFAAFIVLYLFAVVLTFGTDHEFWGDEAHFVNTALAFGTAMSPDILQDYEEVTPPLTFIAYGVWGRIVTFDVASMRIFSLIIAATTFLLFTFILLDTIAKPGHAFMALLLFLINPYTYGLSLFVFTDMLMILFLLLFLQAVKSESNGLIFLSAACGLLTRQYFLFVIFAGFIFFFLRHRLSRVPGSVAPMWALVLACIPLAALTIAWKGPAPPAGIARWVTSDSSVYHPSSITLYAGLLFIYTFPLLILKRKQFLFSRRTHLILTGLSLLYFLFPVQPSEVSLHAGIETVGLFHKALRAVLPSETAVHAVFYVAFLAGLHLLAGISREAYSVFQRRRITFPLVLYLLIGTFLLVMPFSYQVWEKYALPVIPVVLLALLATGDKNVPAFEQR